MKKNSKISGFNKKFISAVMTAALVLIAGQVAAETPKVVVAPALDRDANLVFNGSFEVGHPGVVFGPPVWHNAPDTVYWALVDGGSGTHNPANRGDLSLYPANVEMTPPGWTGSGGLLNYAEWVTQYPAGSFIPVETGPAGSTAPSHGDYSIYFGNYYMASVDIPQVNISIATDGEWIFEDSTGERVDPVILPGQNYRPEVRISQTLTGLCPGSTYRLSFVAFGEFGHPAYIEFFEQVGQSVADGFFGLEITGYDTLYLNIPAGYDKDPFGYLSPFGPDSEHTYTVEFVAAADTVDIEFINWGHFSGGTSLGGTNWVKPTGVGQTTELVLDDVILNGATVCQDGTGTPGYWKNHPEQWPVFNITIGGIDYTKEEAIALMLENNSKDVTYILFRSLVAAKLNVLAGNDSSCVDETIAAADQWMAENEVGSGVKAAGRYSPWRYGEPLYLVLDDYNNGLLCAPHRDL